MRVWLFGGLAWLVLGLGCGDDGGVRAPDAGALPTTDGGGADARTPLASDAAASALPACNLVCDRVLDCASANCAGIDWRTARLAQDLCDDACGAELNAPVMAAADCAAVMQVVQTAAPAVDVLCDAPPCETACQQFALCTKSKCTGYADQSVEGIRMGCMGWCDDDNAGDLVSLTCDALVEALTKNDASFAASCHGSTGCAEASACEVYADKTTGCILSHCAGNADAFEAGVHATLVEYCANADDCPAPESIALLTSDAIGCDDPPLDAVGPAAPFTTICDGTVGTSYASLLAACDTVMACGAMLASNELCATSLTFEAGAATKVACIAATNGCAEVFACL